jgi:hypothetical protein
MDTENNMMSQSSVDPALLAWAEYWYAIQSGNLKGNSRSHALRLAQFAQKRNPKSDSYVR